MEFLVTAKRKIIRLICTIFIVACVLGVEADLSIAMGVKACEKLQGQISQIRKHMQQQRNMNRDLLDAMVDARGDIDLYNSLKKQMSSLADEYMKNHNTLEAKEAKYDAGCRPPQ